VNEFTATVSSGSLQATADRALLTVPKRLDRKQWSRTMVSTRGRGSHELLVKAVAIATVVAAYVYLTVPMVEALGQVGC
jgi:hypothetical protein